MRITAPGGTAIHLPRKPRALLAYLCLTGGEAVSRVHLMNLLWDRAELAQARFSLRTALRQLRAVLVPAAPGLLQFERETIRLDPDGAWIDAREMPGASGRLLEDFVGVSASFDAWARDERDRFERERLTILKRELDRLTSRSARPRARMAFASRLLAVDPANEAAVRAMIDARLELDDRAGAIREYLRCEQILRGLHLSPSEDTNAAYRRALSSPDGAPPTSESAPVAPGPVRRASPSAVRYRPTLAVLPFREVGEQRSTLGARLHEELLLRLGSLPDITLVSRLELLDRGSPLRVEGLEARYALAGSIQIVDGRYRLTTELTDGATGVAVWRTALDGAAIISLDLSQQLAHHIALGAVAAVRSSELRFARFQGSDAQDAYHFFVRARDGMYSLSRSAFAEAEQLFNQAIERDGSFGEAFAMRGYWHLLRVGQGWSRDPLADIEAANHSVRLAVERAPYDPLAFAVQAHVAAYLRKDFATAFDSINTALRLDPNLATARLWSAAAHAYVGHADRAVAEIEHALTLSPYDPQLFVFNSIASLAYLAAGQFDRAVSLGRRALSENADYTTAHKLLAMSLSLSDRNEEARIVVDNLLRLEPDFSIDLFRSRSPGTASDLGQIYCRALEKAGVPRSGR